MDLDLAQVRAFVATADRLHFGQAAEQLAVSQQALSKRIARLEGELGAQLFLRGGHAVELTEAGRRFLEPARQTLAQGDRAVAAARHVERPLRIDYWGHLFAPMRTLAPVIDYLARAVAVSVETGPGRDLPGVLDALVRTATDVGFGRAHGADGAQGAEHAGYAHRLVRLEPVDVVVGDRHRLADRSEVRPDELRDSVLWGPASLERLDFYRRFAEHFDINADSGTANLGIGHFLEQVAADPTRFALVPADLELPDRVRVRSLPLVEPTPLYAWSLVWRAADPHPGVESLLQAFAELGGRNRWLEYRPGRDWLPAGDVSEVSVTSSN
ncbi:LysR family transcriptional regulator [Catenulispora pinisilvae]|uniref:LysR family transcriptional regulator n=1 Tax=Catenulispora pinisilvae TaxID=2705253 RepID=UPI001892724D|nr:LysR family transcriptional regulator [Catenulispora pinisilvae]